VCGLLQMLLPALLLLTPLLPLLMLHPYPMLNA
jgi:hypothetical protein